jgi:hypothetical protein
MKSKYHGFSHYFCTQVWRFESTYFTPTFFDMIGICKHEKVASIGDTSLAVIVVEIN